MPWDERTPMDERERFVRALDSCFYTMSELCASFGISRKTGYKWAVRWAEEGKAGLRDRSRAPRSQPGRTEPRCEQALVEARQRRPGWGPRKLLVRLASKHPSWSWPAASTAGAILKRHGLVEARPRRRPHATPAKPVLEAPHPNALWAADFKGEFRTGDHQLCYPLTVTDRFSRYLLGCRARRSTSLTGVRPVFERLFAEHGLPEAILTDGGSPFASARSPRRLSKLSVWWVKLGIRPVVIQPGKPQQNGSHERMHRTLKQATARPPAPSFWRQQIAFDAFRQDFNEQRPHEGIGMKTPSQLYRASPRPLPSQLEDPSYPGHYEVRRVRSTGEVKWRGKTIYLSEVLIGEVVGLVETDDLLWDLYFGPLRLGSYDEASRTWDLL